MRNNKNKHCGKIKTAVYIIIISADIAAMATSVWFHKYENVFIALMALALFFVPYFVKKLFNIEFPPVLEIIILLFIFSAEILGEMNGFYMRYPFWDTILHTVSGFLCAAIGFAAVDILNRSSKVKFNLSPTYLALVAFCFSMTAGVIWEFFEFSCDMLFHTDMQKDTVINSISSFTLNTDTVSGITILQNISETTVNGEVLPISGYLDIGLIDTMKDLLVNFIGAAVFSIIGYHYIKNCGKGRFAQNFILRLGSESDETD